MASCAFLLGIKEKYAEDMDEVVSHVLDDLDVELEGDFEWVFWKEKLDHRVLLVLKAPVTAKSIVAETIENEEYSSFKSISVEKALSFTKMRDIDSSKEGITSSKKVKSLIAQWNVSAVLKNKKSESDEEDSIVDVKVDPKKSGESWQDFANRVEQACRDE